MNVGTPGMGLATLFYLGSVIWMLVKEIGRTIAGRSSIARWKIVAEQLVIGIGMVAGIWLIAWLTGLLFPGLKRLAVAASIVGPMGGATAGVLTGLLPIVVTLSPLLLVLLLVQLFRLLVLLSAGSSLAHTESQDQQPVRRSR